ncbi:MULTISPECIES: helix-turn-helix domain-containing protein [Enterobacterales]|uniref:helix-turn-helix domain-containing protein n=1 Tax=Enterobacterales TaxID=91347 RepID=UPI002ED81BD4
MIENLNVWELSRTENALIQQEVMKIAKGFCAILGKFCEIMITDGTDDRVIIAIENPKGDNMPGKRLAEMPAPENQVSLYTDIVVSPSITTGNGAPLYKCMDIAIRNSRSEVVAHLICTFDMTVLNEVNVLLQKLTQFTFGDVHCDSSSEERESANLSYCLQHRIDEYCMKKCKKPREMKGKERNDLIVHLYHLGGLNAWGAINETARILNVSRVTVYNALKEVRGK